MDKDLVTEFEEKALFGDEEKDSYSLFSEEEEIDRRERAKDMKAFLRLGY
jgi:hypothetical protein